jgi:hypothetical protein
MSEREQARIKKDLLEQQEYGTSTKSKKAKQTEESKSSSKKEAK